MQEYKEIGHIEPLTSQDAKRTRYYLPHHPFFRKTSSTTKTHFVFDEGAKSSNGISLNDVL
jgi:hypothetical protein